MRKVHEKSIILGIGIGMIVTSIAGMIYSAGTRKDPTKEEVIRLAKGYGMVEQVSIINDDDDPAAENSAADTSSAGATAPGVSQSSGTAQNSTAADSNSAAPGTDSGDNTAAKPSGGDVAQKSTTTKKAVASGTGKPAENTGNKSAADKPAESKTAENEPGESSTTVQNAAADSSTADSNVRDITVKISRGSRAKAVISLLVQKGVIADSAKFKAALDKYNGSTRIIAGTYKFKKNDDPDYVARAICRIKN